jgi:hypothetical protein
VTVGGWSATFSLAGKAMINATLADALEEVVRALQRRLFAPEEARERRVRELGLLARLLNQRPQDPSELPTSTARGIGGEDVMAGGKGLNGEADARTRTGDPFITRYGISGYIGFAVM